MSQNNEYYHLILTNLHWNQIQKQTKTLNEKGSSNRKYVDETYLCKISSLVMREHHFHAVILSSRTLE